MIDILFVITVVLLGVLVVSVLNNIFSETEQVEQPKQKIKCKLHDWVTDEQTEKLVCCRCGQIAGQIDHDELDE